MKPGFGYHLAGTCALMAAMAALPDSAAARARSSISPYLAVDQSVLADLKGGDGGVVTYTSVSVGVTARVETRDVALTADARYRHEFAWNRDRSDRDVLSGLAVTSIQTPVRGLTIEGGALATRIRGDGITGANSNLLGVDRTAQVYSAYAGPTYTGGTGDLSINAAYRLGYNRVDDDFGQAAGVVPSFDQSWSHYATASVGMQPDVLPFGWSLGVGYERESQSQLDQRYVDRWARVDITLPVTSALAMVGGIGYENIEISNRDALRDANGVPLFSSNGRFVTDPASPRRIAYDEDGLIGDAGVLWRPSRRTSLEARVGYRYGSTSYTGAFSWTPHDSTNITLALFDSVDSFGRALTGSLANLSTDSIIARNAFTGDLTGCVFNNGNATGSCFNEALTSVSTANFRTRGILAQFATRKGGWAVSSRVGYTRRRFIAGDNGVLLTFNGVESNNVYGDFSVRREFDRDSSAQISLYSTWFDSGFTGNGDVLNSGAVASYDKRFADRFVASAAVGIDVVDPSSAESVVTALAQLGLRYQF